MRIPKPALLPAALVALSLTLAACGGGDEETPAAEQTESTDAPAAEAPAHWPFTGEEPAAGETAELDRPALIVKMPNTGLHDTQVGLSKADMVIEEQVEGRTKRLAVIYYSQLPTDIGPLRSVRETDVGIVAPTGGSLVTSGGDGAALGRLALNKIPIIGEGSAGFYRKSGRVAPYNLFTNMVKVAEAAKLKEAARPADYLPWGTEADLPEGKVASSITADFGGDSTEWSYKNGKYVDETSYAAEGDEFPATSVLVLRVKVVDTGRTDPADNPVPESRFVGDGPAMLFHGGKMVKGTWHKDKLNSALTLKTASGELKVPAGKVWVELVPTDNTGGSVSFGK